MKGDFSRWEHNYKKNFNGVLHQQGKVLLDSDWNVQTQINVNWQDQAGRDAIGSGVAAIPADKLDGFKVTKADVINTDKGNKVKITLIPGRAWADGLLVYLNGDKEVIRIATYLQPPIQDPSYDESSINEKVRDAVILEVWREEINAFQMPDELIEPALGGPDTTERVHTATAFRLLRLAVGDTCSNIRDKLRDDFSKKGKLRVSLQPTKENDGECPVVEGGGYVGLEHNLYRIEIAKVDISSSPMFKWSQFNGGLVGRGRFVVTDITKTVEITNNLQPIITSGLNSFYLEAIEYDRDLGYWRVTYGAKATLNSNNGLNLSEPPLFGTVPTSTESVFFRLWNSIEKIADFRKVPASEEPKNLKDGIRLEFDDPVDANYIPGDYWTFPVRAGEVKNQDVLINNKPPEGIYYHRVPLAILKWKRSKALLTQREHSDIKEIDDCRDIFKPLTNQNICCSYTVGDGKCSHGDFDSIEEAIRQLPDSGGQICLLPGLHEANVFIEGRENIRIRGCDKMTKVIPGESNREAPIFHVKDSRYFILEHMDIVTLRGTAIVLEGTTLGKLREIEINNNRIQAYKNAVRVEKGVGVCIHNNRILMSDVDGGDVAIQMMAEDSVIGNNDIGVIASKHAAPPDDITDEDDLNPVDPCAETKKIYKKAVFLTNYTNWTWSLQPFNRSTVPENVVYKTPGGIQIAGESERIKILGNRINSGSSNGITLGEIPSNHKHLKNEFEAFLYNIDIEGNEIRNMGLNGIGVVGFFSLKNKGITVSVEDLTIYRNLIEYCAMQIPKDTLAMMKKEKIGLGGISLADCENLIIRENCIQNNGKSHLEPISGIFILHGEKIDISDNRILNNGPRISEKDEGASPGIRGGIIIALGFKPYSNEIYDQNEFISSDGIPAVKVHDNIVTQPFGQALFIMALGPISVIGNHLTSQGVYNYKVNRCSLLVGSVLIFNLGVSKDLVGLLFPSFKNRLRANFKHNIAEAGLPYAYYLPSGNVLFSNNQTTLDLRSSELNTAISSQLIFSFDDVSYVGNQSEYISSFVVISDDGKKTELDSSQDIVLTNTLIYAVTVRANDNRFQEGITRAVFSLISFGLIMNTTVLNQATHCLQVLGRPSYVISSGNTVLIRQAVVGAAMSNCKEISVTLQNQYGWSLAEIE